MTFEIEISDATVVELEKFLDQQYGPAEFDQDGNRTHPKQYPGGVDQWLRERVGEAIANTPAAMADPAVRAKQLEILARTQEMLELTRPVLRRRQRGSQ